MNKVSFKADHIKKTFNRRNIFTDISFSLQAGDSLAITGKNGSGKSTLLKIFAGVLSPTTGKTELFWEDKIIKDSDRFNFIGLVSPYLQLYDEFTGWENLDLFRKIRMAVASDSFLDELLKKVNIWERRNDYVRTYSSGMKQRLKYAFALLHNPAILLLDEPTSNLDSEGRDTVYRIMDDQRNKGILIVATNESEDVMKCNNAIDLNAQSQSNSKR